MSKFVYRRVYNPDTNMTSGTQPVSRGGTSATTALQALANLGMIASNRLGVAGGAAKLNTNSKVDASNLPTGFGTAGQISIDGPTKLETGATGVYTITDYDDAQVYNVSVSAGTVKREDEVITVVAPSTAGNVTLTVGDQTFNLEIVSAAKTPPLVSMGQNGTPVFSAPGIEYSGRTLKHIAFTLVAGSLTRNLTTNDLTVNMADWKSAVLISGSADISVYPKYVFVDGWESNMGNGSFSVDLSILDTYLTGQEVYGVAGKDSIITAWTEGMNGSSQFSFVVGLWNPRYNQTLGFHRQLVTNQLFSVDGSSDTGKISDYLVIQVSRCDSYVLVYNPYVNTGIVPANSIHMYYLEDTGTQIVPSLLWTYNMGSYNLGVPDYSQNTINCNGTAFCISGLAKRNDGKYELRVFRNYSDSVNNFNVNVQGIGCEVMLYDPAKGGKSNPLAYSLLTESQHTKWTAAGDTGYFYGRPHLECSPDGRLVYGYGGMPDGVPGRIHVVLAVTYGASYSYLTKIASWSGAAWNSTPIAKDRFCKIINNSQFVRFNLNDRSGELLPDETDIELFTVRFEGDTNPEHILGAGGPSKPSVARHHIGPRNHTLMYLFKPSDAYRNSVLSSYYPDLSTGTGASSPPQAKTTLKMKPFWKQPQERLYNVVVGFTDKSIYHPLADFRIPNTSYIRSGWDWGDHAAFPSQSGKYMGGLQTYPYGEYGGNTGIVTAIVVRSENGIRRLGTLIRWFSASNWSVELSSDNPIWDPTSNWA